MKRQSRRLQPAGGIASVLVNQKLASQSGTREHLQVASNFHASQSSNWYKHLYTSLCPDDSLHPPGQALRRVTELSETHVFEHHVYLHGVFFGFLTPPSFREEQAKT